MLRRAMTLAIDREALVQDLLYGYGRVSNGPLPSSWWGAERDRRPWPFDPDQARGLLADRGFERRSLWNAERAGRRMARAALPFLFLAPLLALGLLLLEPERLFSFVRQRPLIWALVMLLYPLLSAYPQGVIYRVFIFHNGLDCFG